MTAMCLNLCMFTFLHFHFPLTFFLSIHPSPSSSSFSALSLYNAFLSSLMQPIIKCNLSCGGSDVQRARQEVRLLFKPLTFTRRVLTPFAENNPNWVRAVPLHIFKQLHFLLALTCRQKKSFRKKWSFKISTFCIKSRTTLTLSQ